jgi:hypothetical protein
MIHTVHGKLLYFTIFSLVANEKWSECSGNHKANKMYNTPVDTAELFTAKCSSMTASRQIKQGIPNIPVKDLEFVNAKEVQ